MGADDGGRVDNEQLHQLFGRSVAVVDKKPLTVLVGEGKSEEYPYILETDWKFLEKYPDADAALNALRQIEYQIVNHQEVTSGYNDPQKIEQNKIPGQIFQRIDILFRYANKNPSDAIDIVLKQAYPVLLQMANDLVSSEEGQMYFRFATSYYLRDAVYYDQEAVQRNLSNLLNKRGGMEEEVASAMVLYTTGDGKESMRISDKKFDPNNFEYYGKKFRVDLPIGNYKFTEGEVGYLLIYDKDDRCVGLVKPHPDIYNFGQDELPTKLDLIAPVNIDYQISTRRFAGFEKNFDAFAREFRDLFDDNGKSSKSIWSKLDLPSHGVNSNAITLESKYQLWRLLSPNSDIYQVLDPESDPQKFTKFIGLLAQVSGQSSFAYLSTFDQMTAVQLGDFISRFDDNLRYSEKFRSENFRLMHAVNLLKQDPEMSNQYLEYLVELEAKPGYEEASSNNTTFRYLSEFIEHSGKMELYIVESAQMILSGEDQSEGPEIQDRIRYLLSVLRTITSETVDNFNHAKSKSDESLAWYYGDIGVYFLQNMIGYVFESNQSLRVAPPEIPPELKRIIAECREKFPSAKVLEYVTRMHQLAYDEYLQLDISESQREKWLWDFYKHVISLGVYDAELAKVYKDVSGIEETQFASLIESLVEQGFVREAKVHGGDILVSVGCGPGFEIDRPVLEKLFSISGWRPAKLVGVDAVNQDSTTFWADGENFQGVQKEFIHSKVEDLLNVHPELRGRVGILEAFGSPLNNMSKVEVQVEKYMRSIAELLSVGGIAIIDTGDFETARNLDVNQRAKLVEDFRLDNPGHPEGTIGIIDEYQRPDDEPGEVGAWLYSEEALRAMALRNGLMIFETDDMSGLSYKERLNMDPKELIKRTIEAQNGIIRSTYVANPPKDWDGVSPLNIRRIYILIKPEGWQPPVDLSPILDPLSRASRP